MRPFDRNDLPPVNPEPMEDAPTRIEHGDNIQPDAGASADEPKLVVIGGNDRGREVILEPRDTSIGRGLDNDLVLADIAVSRKHTLICYENGQHVVRDLGSGNGTLLNGRRAHHAILADGDQIEVGNTLIRYVAPAAPEGVAELAAAPTVVGQVGEMIQPAGGVHQTVDVRGGAAAAQAVQVTDGRGQKRAKGGRSRKLLLFGAIGLVVFFGGMIGLKVVLKKRKQAAATAKANRSKVSPDELAARHFEEGTKQYRARNWEKARSHYLKVLAVAPGFDQAKRYADQAAAETKARDALAAAKSAISTKDYPTARSALANIPSTSVYVEEARKLRQDVDDKQVQDLLESAKLLKNSGDEEGALARVKKAMKVAPTNTAVKALYAELSGDDGHKKKKHHGRPTHVASAKHHSTPGLGKPRTTPRVRRGNPTSVKSAPVRAIRVSGAGARKALSLYRAKQWGPAYMEMKRHVQQLSGKRKSRGEKLLETIRSVAQAVMRAERDQVRNPRRAMSYYEKALKLDQRVPRKPHQAMLKGRLAKVARVLATSAMASRRYSTAYAAVRVARKYGGNSAQLASVVKQLEGEAQRLFTRGYTIRSSNPAKAKRMWQQVLKMVPAGSAIYTKAYKWLNSSGPSYQDEDED
ncbi:MAG: FHA domain-containing protein [Myxococcales bacterium]|nr:FHA domain-containing protein [Myxococcales bacterium]